MGHALAREAAIQRADARAAPCPLRLPPPYPGSAPAHPILRDAAGSVHAIAPGGSAASRRLYYVGRDRSRWHGEGGGGGARRAAAAAAERRWAALSVLLGFGWGPAGLGRGSHTVHIVESVGCRTVTRQVGGRRTAVRRPSCFFLSAEGWRLPQWSRRAAGHMRLSHRFFFLVTCVIVPQWQCAR